MMGVRMGVAGGVGWGGGGSVHMYVCMFFF